jgi:hypothetical protein
VSYDNHSYESHYLQHIDKTICKLIGGKEVLTKNPTSGISPTHTTGQCTQFVL